jgi:hypothetical protein
VISDRQGLAFEEKANERGFDFCFHQMSGHRIAIRSPLQVRRAHAEHEQYS